MSGMSSYNYIVATT